MRSLSDLTAARLASLLEVHQVSPYKVGPGLGHNRLWLPRKFEDPTRIRLGDLDQVLGHLGEPVDRLTRPVLTHGQRLALLTLGAGAAAFESFCETATDLEAVRADVANLYRQGLVTAPDPETATLTELGAGSLESTS